MSIKGKHDFDIHKLCRRCHKTMGQLEVEAKAQDKKWHDDKWIPDCVEDKDLMCEGEQRIRTYHEWVNKEISEANV